MKAFEPVSISTHSGPQWASGFGWYLADVVIPKTTSKRVWFVWAQEEVYNGWKAWLNGKYIGISTGSPEDIWRKPAAIDITGKYLPGEKVRIAVRVHDYVGEGGIQLWKPGRITATD